MPSPSCIAGMSLRWIGAQPHTLNCIERAAGHTCDHAEVPVDRAVLCAKLRNSLCITYVHVGDFEAAAKKSTTEALVNHLEKNVCK